MTEMIKYLLMFVIAVLVIVVVYKLGVALIAQF